MYLEGTCWQTPAGPVLAASVSVSSYGLCSWWLRGPCFLLVIQSCWLLHSLYLHFHRLPGALREVFNKDNRFRLSVSSSLTLHYVWFIISVFSPICCRSNFLWHWLSKVLICEYSKMSLGLIFFLLLFSFGLVLFCFMLGSLVIQSQVSSHPTRVGCEFLLLEWALGQIRYWLVTPTNFVTLFH